MKQKFIIINPIGWGIIITSVLCTVIIYLLRQGDNCMAEYDTTQQEVAIKYLKKGQINKAKKVLGTGCQYTTDKAGQQIIIWDSLETNNQIRALVNSQGKLIKYDIKGRRNDRQQ